MNNLKIEIKWALIFTIVALAWMLLEKLSGLHDQHIAYHMYLTNLFAIPAIIMMVLALKDKKKYYYQGQMTYVQGLISGALVSLFVAILSPLSQWITTNIISPSYFPNVINYSVEQGYYENVEAASAYFNYSSYAVQSAIGALVMGIITTAIAMIFLRTKNN